MSKKVSISKETYEKLEKRVKEADFDSVDSYVEYILKQVIEKFKKQSEKNETYSREEEEMVKKRLKGLGYLE